MAPVRAQGRARYSGNATWGVEGFATYTGDPGPVPVEIELAYVGGEIRDVNAELMTP
jgi:hypothetical protein